MTSTESATTDVGELLTRPYDPSDYKDANFVWLPFDPAREGAVVLNDLANGRDCPIGLGRFLGALSASSGGSTPPVTFTAPLVEADGVVTLTTGPGLHVADDALAVKISADANNVASLSANDQGVFAG